VNTQAATKSVPLCVDLDGTLTRTDLLFESLARLLKAKPWMLFQLPFWLLGGKAALKRNLARRVAIDAASLPYNESFVEWLRDEKRLGREIILVTAADATLAKGVAAHLGLFESVLASDGNRNLKGKSKRDALLERFPGNFEYAGDSRADVEVWRDCLGAVVVNARPSLIRRVRKLAPVVKVFDREGGGLRHCLRAMRVHQWAKNALIYIPLVTSHRFMHLDLVGKATIGALLFGLCSSAQYILNDLVDLEADRAHATKRLRPFADGTLSIQSGLLLVPLLLAIAIGCGFLLSKLFAALLVIYFLTSLAYSLYLKRVMLLDVFVLAALYTFRIIVGHLVTGIAFSEWMLSFSIFLFLSLAFSKRAAELRTVSESKIAGRGYEASDLGQVNLFGVCSAFLSAVIFIQYLQSENVRELYRNPKILWLLSPVFLFWVSRLWMLCSRGELHEDPIIFVLKDRVTYVVGAVAGLIMLAATVGWGSVLSPQ
jgi:4-hydroxybenzoate polyprenyltransferase/phosphoserine phosphatase